MDVLLVDYDSASFQPINQSPTHVPIFTTPRRCGIMTCIRVSGPVNVIGPADRVLIHASALIPEIKYRQ